MSGKLKAFAAYAIKEMKVSNSAKKQLINFVANEATETQLMSFLMDGEIVQLDEHAEAIVKDRFEANADLREALTQMQRDMIFGNINRMFGACAKKCGRIALSLKRRECKANCVAKRDSATRQAKMKAKGMKDTPKGL